MLLDSYGERSVFIPTSINTVYFAVDWRVAYRRRMFKSNILIVRSNDLICTLSFEPICGWACFSGLKPSIADNIRLAIVWRVRRRGERQLRVAVMSTASLVIVLARVFMNVDIGCIPWLLIENIKKSV